MRNRRLPSHLDDYHVFTTVTEERHQPPERPHHTAGSTDVDLAILDVRRNDFMVDPSYRQTVAHGAKHRDRKRDPALAFLAPVKRRITRQGRFVEHLQGTGAIDPHQYMSVLRHVSGQ